MTGAIWLASYPKSGNTWLRLALLSLREGGAPVKLSDVPSFGQHNLQRAQFDSMLEIESGHLTDDEAEDLRPEFNALFFGGKEPRACKVHDAWALSPSGRPLFDAAFTHATIYQLRDPRDIAVSWARFTGHSLDQAIDTLGNPDAQLTTSGRRGSGHLRQRVGSWSGHIESWVDQSGLDPLVVRYEDMLAEPVESLRRIAARLGWEATDAALEGAVAATQFDRLSDQERKHGYAERADGTERFFRAGKAGGWRQALTPEQAARIERDHGRVMARFGYL